MEVSRETLRKWMVESGAWLSRKQRKSFHQPRLRRECVGELVQIDGTANIAGSSTALSLARCWLSSTMPQAA